jgi:hypothetical protein
VYSEWIETKVLAVKREDGGRACLISEEEQDIPEDVCNHYIGDLCKKGLTTQSYMGFYSALHGLRQLGKPYHSLGVRGNMYTPDVILCYGQDRSQFSASSEGRRALVRAVEPDIGLAVQLHAMSWLETGGVILGWDFLLYGGRLHAIVSSLDDSGHLAGCSDLHVEPYRRRLCRTIGVIFPFLSSFLSTNSMSRVQLIHNLLASKQDVTSLD